MKVFRSEQHAFWSGVQTILAMAPGILPFAAVIGVMATNLHMNLVETVAMSMGFYAGAAQVASLQLMADDALLIVICFTSFMICLRFCLYSAAIAPYLQDMPRRKRLPLLYALTDQSFNLSIVYYQGGTPKSMADSYFVGTSITVWVVWLIGVVAGALLGSAIPDTWSLAFFIPLTFISILIPMLRNLAMVVAALVAAVVTLLGQGLAYNLGLVLGAFAGIGAGLLVEQMGVGKHD